MAWTLDSRSAAIAGPDGTKKIRRLSSMIPLFIEKPPSSGKNERQLFKPLLWFGRLRNNLD